MMHFSRGTWKAAALLLAWIVTPSLGHAITITDGLTFAVASDSTTDTGTHFHSNTGGVFGNPAGKAEVGRFEDEEVRGLSEYDLAGLTASPTAFVTFNVFNDGGLFAGTNDFPFDGTIVIEAYAGNNAEDIADYQAPTTDIVGSFSTSSLGVGDILSFDITSILNTAITNALPSLGLRLRADPLNDAGAFTFDSFRLTTDNQTTAVSEPSMLALLGAGLMAFGIVRRRNRAASTSA